MRVVVALDDPASPGLSTNQTVSAWVEIEKLSNVVYVARPSGLRDDAPGSVFRLEPDGTHASRTNVRLGRGSAREVEVVEGLVEGDEIVVSDVSTWESPRVRVK